MCGFGGNGISLAIGAGRAGMEEWYDGAYIQVNLRRYGLERLMSEKKIHDDYNI